MIDPVEIITGYTLLMVLYALPLFIKLVPQNSIWGIGEFKLEKEQWKSLNRFYSACLLCGVLFVWGLYAITIIFSIKILSGDEWGLLVMVVYAVTVSIGLIKRFITIKK